MILLKFMVTVTYNFLLVLPTFFSIIFLIYLIFIWHNLSYGDAMQYFIHLLALCSTHSPYDMESGLFGVMEYHNIQSESSSFHRQNAINHISILVLLLYSIFYICIHSFCLKLIFTISDMDEICQSWWTQQRWRQTQNIKIYYGLYVEVMWVRTLWKCASDMRK